MESFAEIVKLANESVAKTGGVVTVNNWTMAPDGLRYSYFYCEHWEIVTDGMMPVEKFRSAEHWQLAAVVGNVVLMLTPGCQVKAWLYCDSVPPHRESDCYHVR